MSNFTLIKPDATTLALRVTDIGTLFDSGTRGAQTSSPAGMVYGLGDFVDQVQPIQFKLLVLKQRPSDEPAARDERATIRNFARAARYLKRDATGDYRALQEGNAVAMFTPSPVISRFDAWEVSVILLPAFPRWTTTAVYTLSGYDAATKV